MCSFKVNKQSNMKTCVMVVAHKSFEDSVLQRNWGYKVIKVGKGMSDSNAIERSKYYSLDKTMDRWDEIIKQVRI